MEKNVAGKWIVFAYGDPDHATLAGKAVTGDAANITANIRIDGGAANAVDDTNPTELEDGYYVFDITAVESNGDLLSVHPASATANVIVIGVPGATWTRPANFNDLSVTATTGRVDVAAVAGTAQTANDNGNDINNILTDTQTTIPGLIAALNDLDAAGIRSAVGLAAANMDTQFTASATATGFATAAALATTDGKIDTVDTVVDGIQTDLSNATDGLGAIKTAVDATATAAALATVDANVDTMVAGIITGSAQTGTLSVTQATSDLSGYTADQLIGRIIVWTSGVCDGEASDITDYEVTNARITFTALTLAPGNGDTFKIV